MNQPRPAISAALAISIERQVDEMIATAQAKCAILAHISESRAIAELQAIDDARYRRPDAESTLARAPALLAPARNGGTANAAARGMKRFALRKFLRMLFRGE